MTAYTQNLWAPLFATVPDPAEGVPLPDGSRFVCELCKITVDNIDNAPPPVWADISSRVTSIDWATGDTSGAISRWPVEQFVVTTSELTDLLGDFVDLTPSATSTAPAPGAFLRWGILEAGGSWLPFQSGMIETLEELVSGRVRGWRIQAFGTLIYYAGIERNPDAVATAGDNISTMIGRVLAGTYEASSLAPWPWAQTVAAQNPNFPTTLYESVIKSNRLALLYQLADSQGMRVFNGRDGSIQFEEWTVTVPTPIRLSDEPVPGELFGNPSWKRSVDRTGAWYGLANKNPAAALSLQGLIADQHVTDKWNGRTDIIGFPKNDLLGGGTIVPYQNMGVAVGPLLAHELRLDQIDCDTARDAGVWKLLTAPAPVWVRSVPTFVRRRPGLAFLEVAVFVHAVAGTLDFSTGIGRARISYYTRLI